MLVKVAIRETEIPKRTLPMVSQCDGPSKTGDLYVEPKAIHSSNENSVKLKSILLCNSVGCETFLLKCIHEFVSFLSIIIGKYGLNIYYAEPYFEIANKIKQKFFLQIQLLNIDKQNMQMQMRMFVFILFSGLKGWARGLVCWVVVVNATVLVNDCGIVISTSYLIKEQNNRER
ncbi:hypothetical protein BLOT_008207 [Blomia tropicalis]|nr:hypothetical protein BLOT_008207 [Blomia tropicalis]